MPDSRTASRTLTGVCLILGPLLLVVQAAVTPAWSVDPGAFQSEVAAAPDRFAVAGMLVPVAAFVLIVGLIGALRLLRTRLVNLAQVGCSLIMFAMTFFSCYYAIFLIDAVSTRPAFDQAQMLAMLEEARLDPYAPPFAIAVYGVLPLGHLLLVVGLVLRRAVVPLWVPAVLLASLVLLFVEAQLFWVAGYLLMAVGLGWLGLRILRTPDDEWERWLVLPERDAVRQMA